MAIFTALVIMGLVMVLGSLLYLGSFSRSHPGEDGPQLMRLLGGAGLLLIWIGCLWMLAITPEIPIVT